MKPKTLTQAMQAALDRANLPFRAHFLRGDTAIDDSIEFTDPEGRECSIALQIARGRVTVNQYFPSIHEIEYMRSHDCRSAQAAIELAIQILTKREAI